MSFLTMNEAEVSADETNVFKANEVVKFICMDHKEDTKYGAIRMFCKIDSGEHKGKTHEIYISSNNAVAKAQFAKAFWSKDEIINNKASLARLINRPFQAKASKVYEKEGRKTQYFNNFIDLFDQSVSTNGENIAEETF